MRSPKGLRRVERGVRPTVALRESPEPPGSPDSPQSPDSPTAEQLAREAAAAFADTLERYRRATNPRDAPIDPTTTPDEWEVRMIREKPPHEFSFDDLDRLAKIDPALAVAEWEKVRTAAANELDTGYLAARSLEYLGGSGWERACFAAIRRRLRDAWPPRNAGEAMIIDQLAQYEMMRQRWVTILSMMGREPETILRMRRRGVRSDRERALDAAEGTLEAARMVERLQRLYQNTLRTLMSLRRGRAPFIVQRRGQVNVAMGPQLNVESAVGGPGEPAS
jgi:hypothetical protein